MEQRSSSPADDGRFWMKQWLIFQPRVSQQQACKGMSAAQMHAKDG